MHSCDSIIADLDKIYDIAVREKNLTCAIRAKLIQAQLMGLFKKSSNKPPKLVEMTDEEIKDFINFNAEIIAENDHNKNL